MLADTKQHLWKELVKEATQQELIWMNGFLSGLLAANQATEHSPAKTPTATPPKITIAYGTETGNSKGLATRLTAAAKKRGLPAKLVALDQYKPEELAKGGFLYIVISTQGDGEPPLAALKFYDHVRDKAKALDNLQYAVLALGDTSYPLFCKAGEDIDQYLAIAGAKRFATLLKCDTDYEADSIRWFEQSITTLSAANTTDTATQTTAKTESHGKKNHTGIVATHINLNDRDSAKETYHIEIEAEGIHYEPGDALGILPENPAAQVDEILSLTGTHPEKSITYKNNAYNLGQLLKTKLNLSYLPARTVKKYAAITRHDIPETKIGLADLLKIYPVKDETQFEEIIEVLEPLTPRLYSISSSPAAHTGSIHITVSKDTYGVNTETRFGLCSDYLATFAPGSEIAFYIYPNRLFRLPHPDKDLIMIGPGTGIAPFRSFIAEREARGSEGRNWLFFGDQHFVSDFLYQTEIQSWQETGVLTQVNVAFSRDQEEKVYVQHKMLEHGSKFFEWLEAGAFVYVCGNKAPMSTDVEDTILTIIQTYGRQSKEEALYYLEELKTSGRYLKDVY